MAKQSTLEKPKTRNISHKFTPNCALRNLAGFAEFAQICSTTQTRNRDAFGAPYLSNLDSGMSFGSAPIGGGYENWKLVK